MVVQRSPKPLAWVRFLPPLPKETFERRSFLFTPNLIQCPPGKEDFLMAIPVPRLMQEIFVVVFDQSKPAFVHPMNAASPTFEINATKLEFMPNGGVPHIVRVTERARQQLLFHSPIECDPTIQLYLTRRAEEAENVRIHGIPERDPTSKN
jgi:hypothetical protein